MSTATVPSGVLRDGRAEDVLQEGLASGGILASRARGGVEGEAVLGDAEPR